MTELKTSPLEQKRFPLTERSLVIMKKAKEVFAELKVEFPYLSGVGFFGSRARGLERPDSDMDACIFYDANQLLIDTNIDSEMVRIKDRFSEVMGVPLGQHTGWKKNLSQEKTDIDIYNFFKFAKMVGNRNRVEAIAVLERIPETQNLFSRFFLGVGDKVYDNRQYILDQFSEVPEGDKYFELLMGSLASFERDNRPNRSDVPLYTRYPKTIADAREYFLTQPHVVV